jgi:hypothetical protein
MPALRKNYHTGLTNFMELIPHGEAASCETTQEFISNVIEPEDSVLCSKYHSISLHPVLDQSIPYHPIQ